MRAGGRRPEGSLTKFTTGFSGLLATAVLLTTGQIATASAAAPPPLHTVHDPGRVTGTVHGPCHARDNGQLPDPRCTPGAYDPAITKAVLCRKGYSTSSYRPPEAATENFKYDEAYPAYGLPKATKTELDHLVPLELGGANDASNLWPEVPPSPNPKDNVENRLHDEVCSGQTSLAAAQLAIAANWMTAK